MFYNGGASQKPGFPSLTSDGEKVIHAFISAVIQVQNTAAWLLV